MSERLAIVVADHVVHENNAAELGPSNTALLDLGIHAPVIPVSVRTQDRGHSAALIRRPVEVAAEREAGKGLENNLLDRVIVAIELSADLGVERGLGKHRPEPQRDQHLLAEMNGPVAPGLRGRGRPESPHLVQLVRTCARRASPVGSTRLGAPSDQIKRPLLCSGQCVRKATGAPAPVEVVLCFASSVLDSEFLGARVRSLSWTSFVTTTLSTAPLARFILPSVCQRGSGSPDFGFERKRERAVFGCEAPLVARRSPDVDSHFAGEPWVDALGQPGKITRRVQHCRVEGPSSAAWTDERRCRQYHQGKQGADGVDGPAWEVLHG